MGFDFSHFSHEENAMKCVICKHGQTRNQAVTVTFDRNEATVIVKSVPARVCENCGEQYLDQEVTARLLQQVEQAAGAGILVEVREYIAA